MPLKKYSLCHTEDSALLYVSFMKGVVVILVQDIKNCVKDILSEKANISIKDEAMYYKGLIDIGLNSLLFIKLLVNLEAELDIEFEEDLINSNYIGNLDQLISIVTDMVELNSKKEEESNVYRQSNDQNMGANNRGVSQIL